LIRRSDGFLDLPAPDATGADPNAAGLSLHKGVDGLKIGLEDPLADAVRVADLIPDHLGLPAYETVGCHDKLPCKSFDRKIL
jgi:hypothetical protein